MDDELEIYRLWRIRKTVMQVSLNYIFNTLTDFWYFVCRGDNISTIQKSSVLLQITVRP